MWCRVNYRESSYNHNQTSINHNQTSYNIHQSSDNHKKVDDTTEVVVPYEDPEARDDNQSCSPAAPGA